MASSHKTVRRKVGTFRPRADGTIEVIVSHGYNYNGKPRRLSAISKDEIEAERLALELAAQLGKRPDLGMGLTLERWWAAYSVGKGDRITKATFERYAGDMRRIWLPALGKTDISLIAHKDVQAILLSLPTNSQASHAKASLSAVLTQAVRDGYLSENPLKSAAFELPGDVGTQDDGGTDWSSNPFDAIENTSDVWDVQTVLAVMPLLRGVPLEPCWLCMVGAGLRREEALALTWRDVRRISIGGRMVTQLAVYKAYTAQDGLKRTKTRRSVRIVAVMEPFGARLWELHGKPDDAVCPVSVANIQRRWKNLFEPVTSKHAKTEGRHKGKLFGFRYVPLNRMRATHSTIIQQAGVQDSINAAMHGHSEKVSYTNYQRANTIDATMQAGEFLLVRGGKHAANG